MSIFEIEWKPRANPLDRDALTKWLKEDRG